MIIKTKNNSNSKKNKISSNSNNNKERLGENLLNMKELEELRTQTVADCNKSELVDLKDIKINRKKSKSNRMLDYIKKIKNPYLFKVGDMAVKIEYVGEKTISEALACALRVS